MKKKRKKRKKSLVGWLVIGEKFPDFTAMSHICLHLYEQKQLPARLLIGTTTKKVRIEEL